MIRNPARGLPADDTKTQHQREHLGAARGIESEVRAIGNDMHLRHRHRHTAANPRDKQQALRRADTKPERPLQRMRKTCVCHRCSGCHQGRPLAHAYTQQRHPYPAHHTEHEVCRSPAKLLNTPLGNGRPHRTRQIITAGAHAHCQAASFVPPKRRVGDERHEGAGDANHAKQEPVCQRKKHDVGCEAGQHIPRGHTKRSQRQHARHAITICPTATKQTT